ncbi:DUF4097 family beta strand repeat-containing protein [Streptomyces fructofermentans]|uniref:DUF4097 family beta strand repeat-containing protein n=1 Tax=Streptomyces fructofermentans TaxID=152141 RepID=UPI0037B400FD
MSSRHRPSVRDERRAAGAVARRRRRSLVAVGACVLAVGLLATGCGGDAGDDSDPEHRSFALDGRTLTVDSADSALELVPADVDEVRVTRWFDARVVLGGDPEVTWAMKDDTLTLRVHCSGVVADCSARHRVEVPRGVAVTVKGKDGSVRANGFDKALRIEASDGSVRVDDVSGPLTLRTSDGSVTATGVDSRRVDVDTRDGSVRLDLTTVPDRVSARGQDGSLTIGLPDATYRVTAEADDGAVDVSVPRDEHSPHVVSARTQDGKVTVRTAN